MGLSNSTTNMLMPIVGGISVIGTGNGMVMAQRTNAISIEQSVQLGLVKSAQAGLSTQATTDLSITWLTATH